MARTEFQERFGRELEAQRRRAIEIEAYEIANRALRARKTSSWEYYYDWWKKKSWAVTDEKWASEIEDEVFTRGALLKLRGK